jgi:hypothetical protein
LHRQLVPAQRVQIVELQVDSLELRRRRSPVVRALVVIEDVLAVEIVHRKEGSERSPPACC